MYLANQAGWPLALALRGHARIGQHQTAGGFCHHQVQVELLDASILPGRRRQFHVKFLKHRPVPVREKAGATFPLGNRTFIDTHKEKYLHILQTASCDIPHHDLVNGGRYDAHLDFPKACIQDLGIILHIRLFSAQKAFQTPQKLQHPVIYLGILPGQVLIPRVAPLTEKSTVILQLSPQPHALQIFPERGGHGPNGGPLFLKRFPERAEGFKDPLSVRVQFLKVQLLTAPAGLFPLGFPALPAPDAQGPHIIPQPVRHLSGMFPGTVKHRGIFRMSGMSGIRHVPGPRHVSNPQHVPGPRHVSDSRHVPGLRHPLIPFPFIHKSCLQVPEHTFIGKIPDCLQGSPYQFHQGIFHNAFLIIQEIRDSRLIKLMGQLPSIGSQVPCNHGRIPVTQSFLLNQLFYPAAHIGSLPGRAAALIYHHMVCGPVPDSSIISVQVLLQEIQAFHKPPCRPAAADNIRFLGNPMALCHTIQPAHRMLSHVEQMLDAALLIGIGPRVNGHGAQHLPGMKQEQLHQPVLHRCKSCKTVQKDDAVPEDFPFWQFPAQDIKYFLCRDIMLLYILPEPAVNQLQVLQFLLQQGGTCLPHHFTEHIRRNAILV